MKKKIFIVCLVVFLVAVAFGGMYLIDRMRMKENKPVIFSTWGYSYVPPIDLKEYEIKTAVINYIVDKGDSEYKHHKNEKTFASMRVYLIEEKDKDTLYNIYAWVLTEKYYLETGKVKQDSGSSIPYKYTVEKVENEFVVTDAKFPRDGGYYSDDMKAIFPWSVRNDMEDVHTDGTIEKLELDIQEQVEDYFEKI